MSDQFAEKGKIFTPIIKKIPYDVIIQTIHQRIEGKIHVRPDVRLRDDMNELEMFIAVTDAVIYNVAGEVIYRCNFMLVNRAQIIWLSPVNDIESI